jgi:hypothetical protein
VGLEGWGDFLRVAVCAGNPQKASQAFADPLTGALCQIPKWLKSSWKGNSQKYAVASSPAPIP